MPSGYCAFFPHPLPPKLDIDWPLASLLSEADRAMAELSGAGSLLPNPHLLIRPYLRREAILSSRIENTIAEMDELVLFEMEPEAVPRRPDVQEVANYVRALDLGLQRMQELPISSRLLCEMHAMLLQNVRGGELTKTPGEFRRTQNWIGRPGASLQEATFVPPPPEELHACLGAWENYLHSDSPEPILVKCALIHYQFESIHPFLDGNGRIGRLLITLFLCSTGSLSQPLLYLSGFFDEYRDDYYRSLLAVSQKGAWVEWLRYFLTGVRNQARAALEDTKRILTLYQHYRDLLRSSRRAPSAASGVLDAIFASPLLTISHHSEVHKLSHPTVSKAVEFWVAKGLLRELTGRRRNRLFHAPELSGIMSRREPPSVS